MTLSSDERVRILAVYREMPGLRLTVEQASRLFGMERKQCAAVLAALVADGLLSSRDQHYVVRGES